MAINAVWHRAHRMPKNPTPAQRVDWHVDHAKHCGCRAMPDSIQRLIAEQQKGAPKRPRKAATARKRIGKAGTA